MNKFQVCLIIKEFVELESIIELYTIADYSEICRDFNEVKDSIAFFIDRIEKRLNGGEKDEKK